MDSTHSAHLRGCESYCTGTYTTVTVWPIATIGTEDPDELFFPSRILVFLQFTSAPPLWNRFSSPLVNLDALKLIFGSREEEAHLICNPIGRGGHHRLQGIHMSTHSRARQGHNNKERRIRLASSYSLLFASSRGLLSLIYPLNF
jgi:hypothetical protein